MKLSLGEMKLKSWFQSHLEMLREIAGIVGSSTWQDSVDRGSALSSVGEVGAAVAGFGVASVTSVDVGSSSPPPHPCRVSMPASNPLAIRIARIAVSNRT